MVHAFGALQGTTVEAAQTIGVTAIIVHLAGVMVFGAGTGAARKAGRRGMAVVGTLVVIGASLFSLYNVAGYVIANSEGVAQARALARKAADDAAERQWQVKRERLALQGKLAQQQLKWLQGTTAETSGRRSRRDYVEAGNKLVAEIGKGEASTTAPPAMPIAPSIQPNALAEMVASATGMQPSSITLIVALFMAALLIIVEAVGWMRAGFHWYETGEAESVPASKKGGGGNDGDGVKRLEPAREKKPETVAAKQAEIVPLRKAEAPVAPSPKPSLTLSEYMAQHAGVTFPSQAAVVKAARAAGVANVSPASVSRQFKFLEGRGKVKRSKHKRGANAITYGGNTAAFG
jgi:hypothetical protein